MCLVVIFGHASVSVDGIVPLFGVIFVPEMPTMHVDDGFWLGHCLE